MENLIKKLIEVQIELKAPKNQYSSYGQYYYRSQEDILEALKPLLSSRGLLMTIGDEVINIGEFNYIKSTVKITDGKNTKEESALAREAKLKAKFDDAQITGSSSSYARKYALNGMFAIDDTKDPDTDNYKQEDEKTPPKETNKKFEDNNNPWITEYEVKKYIDIAIERKSKTDEVIKGLRDKYKVSKKYAEQIKKELNNE